MECPTCGYQLSPFDKECLRCKHFERKGEPSSLAFQPEQEIHIPSPPQEQPLPPVQAVQQVPTRQPGLIIFVSAIIVLILVVAYYNYSTQNGLTGRWVDKSEWNTYQFNSDGTATWDFHPPGMSAFYNMTYTADGNTLTETFTEMDGHAITSEDKYFGHPLTRTYTIEGNELIINNPDNGTDWTFSRE